MSGTEGFQEKPAGGLWLAHRDSNPDRPDQNRLSCH